MPTRIKICCLASAEEVRLAIDAGADAIGFIGIQPPTPRTQPDQRIADLIALAPRSVETVLLSNEHTAEGLAAHAARTRAATVQIVHPVDPREVARMAALAPDLRRVKVIHVEGPEALDLIPAYAPHVHAFLLDSGKPNAAKPVYGGTGEVHDWVISAAFVRQSDLPVYLAGGLSPANVADAIAQVRPYGVDLCSGVRTDGRLDPVKLDAFMRAVRQADERG